MKISKMLERNNRFQESYNVKYRNKTFAESSKSRGVFRTQANIMMELFCEYT